MCIWLVSITQLYRNARYKQHKDANNILRATLHYRIDNNWKCVSRNVTGLVNGTPATLTKKTKLQHTAIMQRGRTLVTNRFLLDGLGLRLKYVTRYRHI
jgi:hypothetical protein